MRKLQQVALVFAAAGGLSAASAGASYADAPVGYGGAAAPPVPQQSGSPDTPQAAAWTASQATSHTSGSHHGQQQAAPQAAPAPGPERAPEVSPQVNPQLNPDLSPQITNPPKSGPGDQSGLFRPYQECSPQTLLNFDLPVGLLGAAQSFGTACTQENTQANAFASSSSR
ncbi:hypothetical protein FCH28_33560 [Streptomyces piniterrae]|uniref:Uncharacterized protein n=1 Tax=Streptomyces piniterrae TaxID=2571125 RepID=A0A4U0MQU5_9ACTN|nr:hypothetical protein [Streptomyces piniterrae]TJZ42822.1 hypothetical protein FCH28_33560 [Streptomyces piniterrae]